MGRTTGTLSAIIIASMESLAGLAGQLLTIGFEGQECGPELRELLRATRPGGLIFFQRNIATAEQFRTLVSQIRESLGDSHPFLAIDQEGGEVDRFRELIAPLPSARDVARAGLARELGDLAARELVAFGLNVDFAPVLDLGATESRAVMGSRTAGATPHEVIRFAERFLGGLAGWSVLGCGKHFPGLGGGRKDSHVSMPVIEKSEAELWQEDLLPFRTLADVLYLVMVAHAWYPELEKAIAPGSIAASKPTPASLSPGVVTEILRTRIGFKRLIVCDDLEMGGVLEGRTIEQAGVEAVRAGCNILLVCRHASNVERVHAALVHEAERSSEFHSKLRAAPYGFPKPQMAFADLEKLRRDIRDFAEQVEERVSLLRNSPDAETTRI